MSILKTKKVKLKFVMTALLSCFAMMLAVPFVGEQFGFANSFSEVYLDGNSIGTISDPVNVEKLLLEARLQLAKEQKTMILADVECTYVPVEGWFSRSMSEKELYEKLYEYLKNDTVEIQRAYMMKIGTYTVYLDTIEDVYETLELAKEKYDPDNLFQVHIIADAEREINMYTTELISSDLELSTIETVGIRVSQIPLQEIVSSEEPEVSDETDLEEPIGDGSQEETDSESTDGLRAMAFGEKVEIAEAYVSKELITTAEEAASQITKESQKNEIYEVQSGDTLSTIANNHGLYVKDVLTLNEGLSEDTTLQIGDEIIITVPQPELTIVTVEQSTYEEDYYAETEYIDVEDWYTTRTEVVQEADPGHRQVTAMVTKKNGTEQGREIIDEIVLRQAVPEVVKRGTQTPPTYIKPISGGRLSSNFGGRKSPTKGASSNHKGVDWATPTGTAVMASSGGTVSIAGWQSGYGYVIYINHPDGRQTRYGHLSKILVSAGQKVQQGQKIALSGNTGRSTGPHLHFELRINGQAVNPLNYL